MPQLKAIYTVFRSYHRGGIVAECGAVCRGAVLGKFGFGIVVKVKREDLYRLFAVTEPGKRAYEIGVRRRDGFGKVKTAVGGEPALYGFSGVDFFGHMPFVACADVLHYYGSFLFCHGSVSYVSDCEFVCVAPEYTVYLILRHSVAEQGINDLE